MNAFGSPWPSPPRLENISDDGMPMDSLGELHDGGFEPQTRARSNTWPLPRPENFVDPAEEPGSTKASNQQLAPGEIQLCLMTLKSPLKMQLVTHVTRLF